MAVADQGVGLGWLLAFGMALTLALAGMTPFLGELVSFPESQPSCIMPWGLGFQAAHIVHRWIVLGVILVYCGLTSLVFWRGSKNSTARLAAVFCCSSLQASSAASRPWQAACRRCRLSGCCLAGAGRRAEPDAGSASHFAGRALCAALGAAHGRRLVRMVAALVCQPAARHAAGH